LRIRRKLYNFENILIIFFKDFFFKKEEGWVQKIWKARRPASKKKNPAFEGLESQDPHVVH